ncbi:uncharacterized protein LOC109838073 isoform X2 [Asparagus officinalis]|uniref:uncharacterized protein LOC109838073 isoform X2 n=1 Tax=Asparagus officinalis TaxID=4686 RepID=UPI00098E5004|nr:uncharacterized protein LOC109838073 isoform X2 [Asparagus officinalis]
MEESASESPRADQSSHVPFARGGPIYVPDLVSAITSVPDSKISLLHELQSLEAELDSTSDFDDELSVEELRVFSEEELVERALREGFEDASADAGPSLSVETDDREEAYQSFITGKEIVCSGNLAIVNNDVGSSTSLNTSSIPENTSNGSRKKLQRKKRKLFK